MRIRHSAVAFAGLLVLAAGLAATPSPAPSAASSSPFGEEIDVRVVNVEAVVTDHHGQRVTGLSPGDFTLTVDGKPVDVEYFSEVRDGRSVAPAEEPATPHAGTVVAGDGGVKPMSAAGGGTHYLVFVDDYLSIGAQRDVVLASLQRDLARLGPDDRMAIVAFDGGRLTALSGWTGSFAELSQALDRAAGREAHGVERLTEHRSFKSEESLRREFVGDGTPLDLSARGADMSLAQSSYGGTLFRQIQASVSAASGAMRAFADPPGRKVLLLLAGSWPYSVRNYVTGGRGLPRAELPEGDYLLRPLTDTANLLGYTIYPVDVPGSRGNSGADVEATAPSLLSSGLSNEIETESSLLYLARETGGRALLDGNRASALASVSDDTRSFYWLGFVPSWRGDDRAHKLGVEVRRPGLEVRSRTGFLDLSRQAETSMRLESALLLGSYAGALPISVRVGEPKRLRRGVLELPLTLQFPVEMMTMVPVDGKYAAKLELRFAASHEHGASSSIPVVPIELMTDEPPVPGKLVRHDVTIKLHGRADHLVVAAYDPLTDRMATAEADISTH